MKKRRLFENVIEFLLLCLVLFLYFGLISVSMMGDYADSGGKDTALGFGLAILMLYGTVYVIAFFVNLVLQSIFLINSSKTKKRYYGTKILLFAASVSVVPTLLRVAFELVMVIDLALFIHYFISSVMISVFFLIPYIIIIVSFYFFDKKRTIKKSQAVL